VRRVSAAFAEVPHSGTPAVLAAPTKGGLAAATRSLAIEYASFGIRVNAVSPDIIQTPVHPMESYEHRARQLPPLGRAGQVSDVVDGTVALLGCRAAAQVMNTAIATNWHVAAAHTKA
jgi:NAD(P)-dependent dehydrogenase (short-subunit alcohol dehydrogenase family)